MLGRRPVDVIIIGFPGDKFSGRIPPASVDLVNSGTIRVIDLLFIMKDADGRITTIEVGDLGECLEGFLTIGIVQPGALNDEDADEVAEDLPLDSAALLIAFESTWAAQFLRAVQPADGVVIYQIRIRIPIPIPIDVVDAVITAGWSPSTETRGKHMGLMRMAAQQQAAAYSRLAWVYDELVVDPCFPLWARILDVLWGGGAGGVRTVLDVACGTGLMAVELGARGCQAVGVDASRPMLDLARARLGPDAALHLATLPGLPVTGPSTPRPRTSTD
ncbi:MAG: DUF6325 family protein [Candidatus Nanopelagicales bacterium]